MSDYHTETIGKYKFSIISDDDHGNPREDFDHVATMACFHHRYRLGDQSVNKEFPHMEDFVTWLKENESTLFSLPIYLYDHSGLTISTAPFSCKWDSGQLGVIYVEKAKFLKEFSLTEWNDEAITRAEACLKAEIEEYDQHLRGDVWGYKIEDTTDPERDIDSCWGIYGDDYAIEEAKSAVAELIKQDEAWAAKATTSVRYLQVKITIKHNPDQDPEDIINEVKYSFKSSTEGAVVQDTEIEGIGTESWV